MFSTGNISSGNSSIIKVSSDGISRNIRVKSFDFIEEKNRLNVVLVNPEDAELTLYFRCPDSEWTAKRQTYTLAGYEHLFQALVPERTDGTGKFGISKDYNNFQEWCNHFISQIDLSKAPSFDIVLLYAKDKAVKDGDKITYPMTVYGSMPFISSVYAKANLDPKKDLDSAYPKFLSYEVVELDNLDNPNTGFAKQTPMENPFLTPSSTTLFDEEDPFK